MMPLVGNKILHSFHSKATVLNAIFIQLQTGHIKLLHRHVNYLLKTYFTWRRCWRPGVLISLNEITLHSEWKRLDSKTEYELDIAVNSTLFLQAAIYFTKVNYILIVI